MKQRLNARCKDLPAKLHLSSTDQLSGIIKVGLGVRVQEGSTQRRRSMTVLCPSALCGRSVAMKRASGTSALALQYGHLLLSASTDKTVKAWNFRQDPEDYMNMRTYYGHTEAVKSVRYSGDGASFITASFDPDYKGVGCGNRGLHRIVQQRSIPNQALFSQREPRVVLSACKNPKVMQYDLRSGEMVQEYNYHLDR